jgi:hypothetical protein
MKRILQTTALALVIMLGASLQNTTSAQPDYDDGYGEGNDVSYQTFYDELSPHGRWIDYPEHGYVWVPNQVSGFRPYETAGHWVWTDGYEWMWVSDYSWGWAPFHYGRWFSDPQYGWMWMPGYEWSPAWVAWRDGGDYYGWAPLRPGINISINFSIGNYNPPVDYWVFAPRRYISSPRIYDYCMDRGRNVTIINNTTIINNYSRHNNVFINGPRRMDAERYAGRINPARFRESSRPGRTTFRNNEVSVYRPRVQRDNNRQFTPRNFDRYDRNGNGQNNRFERNNTVSNRGNSNNLPRREESNNRIERRNNAEVVRPQGNGNANNNRGFERRNTTEGRNNPQADNGQRDQQRQRDVTERNNQARAEQQRAAERGMNERRVRTQEQRTPETRPQGNAGNNRGFERRESRNENRAQQPSQEQRQPREFRSNGGGGQSPQVNRQPQAQSRQFERRESSGGGNREQRGGNGGGNGNSNGRGKRF